MYILNVDVIIVRNVKISSWKRYNEETKRHIRHGLKTTENEAVMKEVNTMLVSSDLADKWNETVSMCG